MKTAFVVCPIGNEGSDVRIRSDNLLKFLLTPVCELNELTLIRADEITTTTVITDDIYSHLNNDDLAIIDITTLNPNVFLELGYRIAKNKPYIIIKDKDVQERYPFDISGIRIMEYSLRVDQIEYSKNLLDRFLKNIDYSANNVIELFSATETQSGIKITRRDNGNISLDYIPSKNEE